VIDPVNLQFSILGPVPELLTALNPLTTHYIQRISLTTPAIPLAVFLTSPQSVHDVDIPRLAHHFYGFNPR
jgi:hypothetical protein